MFNGLGHSIRWEGKRANFKEEIEWACRFLGKEDRVVWYLGIIQRASLIRKMEEKPLSRSLKSKIHRITNRFSMQQVQSEYLCDFKNGWEHFRNIQDMYEYPDMLNYNFFSKEDQLRTAKSPDQVLIDFGIMEKKIHEVYKAERYCNDGSSFIEFDDNWKWFCITEGKSKQEANAMRHCGNGFGNPDDLLLSLREPIKNGNTLLWKPHLTFILNNGYLGEMKGYANQKPKDKFHPYIVRLLQDKRIKGIDGGGFLPKSNFSFADLSIALRSHVLKKNKALNFDPIGEWGKLIVEVDQGQSWYHINNVGNNQQVLSTSPPLNPKSSSYLSLQSRIMSEGRTHLLSEAWCSENLGVLGSIHFNRKTNGEDSEKVEELLGHSFCKEVKEDLLEAESTWAKVLKKDSIERLIRKKPMLFRNTSIEKVWNHVGCCSSFASVFNDRYKLNSRAFEAEGLELETFDSYEKLGQASGVGWLSRLLSNCQCKLRANQHIDLLQLGWLVLRQGIKGPCLFLFGDKIIHFIKTMELEANSERLSLFHEIILRFGPPDRRDLSRALDIA